jgi:transcriptional regulator with XRE-family HTH domain
MITPELSRAARGLLDWTQPTLASKSNLGASTIRAFEKGHRVLSPNNLLAVRHAFEQAGVEFTDGDNPAVRLRRPAEAPAS